VQFHRITLRTFESLRKIYHKNRFMSKSVRLVGGYERGSSVKDYI
jgi:hypothetical protein